jgi:ssDNA-binding Zn-finger/Zn-ribbon topoisomerase 1
MNFMWARNSAAADPTRDQNQTDGSCVSCPSCSYEIRMAAKARLPREFSVLCPACGHRKMYQQADAHNPTPDPAATKAPVKIHFGKKGPMQSIPVG